MAGRLLFVFLMYSFHEVQAQALIPPKLTVNPAVITVTETVTLNCQTPSSVSVSQCYFYTLSGGTVRVLSCLQTLTGTELLKMSHRSLPTEVQVRCFYTVNVGEKNSQSPDSDTSSITIHSQTPLLSVHHSYGDDVLFTCSLPGSGNPDTRCNLYFGEASPVLTTNISRKKTSKKESFCQFTVTIDALLSRLRLVQQRDASCDYSLGSEPNSLSPRSDGYSLTDIVERESSMTPTMPTFSMTKGLTVSRRGVSTLMTPVKRMSGQTVDMPSNTGSSTSTYLTPVKQAPETWILKFVAVVTGCGVIVGVILLVSAILYNKKTGSEEVKSQDPQNKNFDTYHTYYTIAEESAASALKDMVYSTVQTH
ncbi:uncharacterized protein LOC116041594 isoform X2 [Sander lucioperca]|uniref:uncharacterized protein LOC116041594 isoform X2 n=1 Tax=Sander lucioperca TaxID=283035 RepID=UPI00125DAADE|nr:uncharacterized protein LOC116041594 isoform X2 [Sander lucioperca]